MDWGDIAPMAVAITLIVASAGVLIFRPLSKRLGDLLDQMQRDRRAAAADQPDLARIAELLERLTDRIERIEDRQEFTERLLSSSADADRGVSRGAPEAAKRTQR